MSKLRRVSGQGTIRALEQLGFRQVRQRGSHVVHFDKIRQFNAVNLEKGYRTISIYSPREVTTYVSESS